MESPSLSKRHHQKPRIGSKYQVDVPRAPTKCPEFDGRDHLYACGLAVPITCIAFDPQSASRKRKLPADQTSCSYVSTVNPRSPDTQETTHIINPADLNRGRDNGSKDANSCASSSKDKFLTWNQDCATTEDGCLGAGEEEGHTATILPKKRRKRRSCKRNCWLPKRRVSKKPRLEIYSVHCVEEHAEAEVSNFKRKIVPGPRPESWSHAEAASFRLAIFLLGKRFCEISRFIGTKKVIDVSDYYYSKFYGRPTWARWKAAKSFKCKIAVRGEQILEGWRQTELLRRLKLVLQDDAYREIYKATGDFNGHLPEPHPSDESKVEEYLRRKKEKLDAYVFKLKDVVGLELLEKSFGIGGPREGHMSKRDLTSGPYPAQYSLPPRHLKEKHTRGVVKSLVPCGHDNAWPLRSEDSLQSTLSVGENWLRRRARTSEEIAQDFWERVWPALETEGWRTVERKPTIRSSPKLKFLRPGVDKFHREERGISYFDDLHQVIEAVKNDPSLRQLAEQLAEDPMDASDAPDDEEEVVRGGWSDDDDMFETLDGKRTIVPLTVPPARARATDDSSQSSSLDIDLNRSLSAVTSRPQLESASKNETVAVDGARETQSSCEKSSGFPLGGIDLNLLPAEEDCVADVGAAVDDFDRLECEFLDCSSIGKIPEIEPVPVIDDVDAHLETELTLSLGNFGNQVSAPCPSPLLLESVCDAASMQVESPEEGAGTNPLATQFRLLVSYGIEVPSRKRSLSYQCSESQGQWFDNGKELVSLPKKRAITLDWIPRGLGELRGTTFLIRMNKAAAAQIYPEISYYVASAPAVWWHPTRSTDMKFPVESLGKAVQDRASHIFSSPCRLRGQLSIDSFLKACQDTAPGCWSHRSRISVIMPGFQEPRFTTVEACTTSEETSPSGTQRSDSVIEVEEDEEVHGRVRTFSPRESAQKVGVYSVSFEKKSSDILLGSSQATLREDTQEDIAQQVTNPHGRNGFPTVSFRQSWWRIGEANTSSIGEHHRVPVQEEEEKQEEAPIPKLQNPVKSIRFRFRDTGERPVVVSKERSKRVPRRYSSPFVLPKPKAWLRSSTKAWLGRDYGEFSSISGSLNSCLTTDSFPAKGMDEEAPQGTQLRVKSEDNDASVSPSSSMKSWDTDDQDEEILNEDNEEEKPFRDEWKPSCEIYSASAAGDHFDSSLYKRRKRRYNTSMSQRRDSDVSSFSVDSEKKFNLDEHNSGDMFVEADKRIKVVHEAVGFKSSSFVEDMYRDGYEVLPKQRNDDYGIESASRKTKDRRSKPKHQIRNVSCERFLIMLYTESVEEELPVQNRSSQGPFQAPSHLPHLRGSRPNKVRRRRSSLPCRSTQLLVPLSADPKSSASASSKRSVVSPVVPMEEEVTSAIAVAKRPEQDARFTLRRSPLDLSAKSGHQLSSRPAAKEGRQFSKRCGGRWQQCCSGC